MLRFNDDFDFRSEFVGKWNKKIHSLRVAGIIVAILMIICAILCMIYPVKSVTIIGTIATGLILILGIYQIIDYIAAPPLFRGPGGLVSAICNLLIGLLLICSPIEMTINTFAFIFGFILMVYGLNKLSFAHQLSFFGIESYGWVIFKKHFGNRIINYRDVFCLLVFKKVLKLNKEMIMEAAVLCFSERSDGECLIFLKRKKIQSKSQEN